MVTSKCDARVVVVSATQRSGAVNPYIKAVNAMLHRVSTSSGMVVANAYRALERARMKVNRPIWTFIDSDGVHSNGEGKRLVIV